MSSQWRWNSIWCQLDWNMSWKHWIIFSQLFSLSNLRLNLWHWEFAGFSVKGKKLIRCKKEENSSSARPHSKLFLQQTKEVYELWIPHRSQVVHMKREQRLNRRSLKSKQIITTLIIPHSFCMIYLWNSVKFANHF